MSLERIPNNYDQAQHGADVEELPTIIENTEFARFSSGQTNKVSAEAREQIKNALRSQGAKLDMFISAYSQKGAARLVRIMRVIDTVDKELFQEWRIKSMGTEELVDFFSEINAEQHRSVKELTEISDHFRENRTFGSPVILDKQDEAEPDTTRAVVRKLSRKSKKGLLKFFKEKIAV